MPRFACPIGLCVLLTSAVGFAADWNQWRGPNRDGAAESSPPLLTQLPDGGLKPAWLSEPIKSARDGGWSSPVVSDGKVYIYTHTRDQLRDPGPKKFPWLPPEKRVGMSDEEYAEYERKRRDEDEARGEAYKFGETTFCLDTQSGETIWKHQVASFYSRFPQSGTPAVIDGRLYVLGAGRLARCLDAETGRKIWEARLPGEFRDEFMQSSFVLTDGVAVVLASSLFGLDAETGRLLWQGDPQRTSGTHTSPVVWRSPADDRNYIIANVAGAETACFESKTGEELWRVRSEANLSTPVILGDRMLTYGNSRQKGLRCYSLSPSGAELVWTFHGAADKGSSPVVVDGHIYVQGERRLACVDLATGKTHWSTNLDLANPQYTSLFAADRKVFYARDGVLCFQATPEKFTPLVVAKFDESGLMAGEEFFRQQLGLDELETQPDGLEKSSRLFQQKVGRHGPLECATPAVADGRLFIRLKDHLACYDLRAAVVTAVGD